ncbi:MAG TPA: chromate efflux transporter [Solirubrobacteraceae bacterium]|nr:chromate efflux transporter [Solirubrobacteraceae bacterium]
MAGVRLSTVVREWTRIGLTGFGGPPAHIALLRPLVTGKLAVMDPGEFQDANAACGLLPGPASTQMAIFCAYRAAGPWGAVLGGLGFILPAVILIVALSVLFLGSHPPVWVRGAGAGAGAAVPAVALAAAHGFLRPSWTALGPDRGRRLRWASYLGIGVAATVAFPSLVVVALLGCGVGEAVLRRPVGPAHGGRRAVPRGPLSVALLPGVISAGGLRSSGLGALAWTALKVGALSFGGGFVIVPLMQGDAVHVHHWMTQAQFLNAVALGQVTPGPVVATIAAVGYAAHGIVGGLIAAAVAFLPSFAFVLLGGRRFAALRANATARAFLDGAGPAAIGAILGVAVLLARGLGQSWQPAVLAAAVTAIFLARRGVVSVLLTGAIVGVALALSGVTP